jgi:hypothetical protein
MISLANTLMLVGTGFGNNAKLAASEFNLLDDIQEKSTQIYEQENNISSLDEKPQQAEGSLSR